MRIVVLFKSSLELMTHSCQNTPNIGSQGGEGAYKAESNEQRAQDQDKGGLCGTRCDLCTPSLGTVPKGV